MTGGRGRGRGSGRRGRPPTKGSTCSVRGRPKISKNTPLVHNRRASLRLASGKIVQYTEKSTSKESVAHGSSSSNCSVNVNNQLGLNASPLLRSSNSKESSDESSSSLDPHVNMDRLMQLIRRSRAAASSPQVPSTSIEKSRSLNLTEVVNKFDDDASSDADIKSVPHSLVEVSGYTVKEASASILRQIIEKHGDIASRCILDTVEHRSYFLERVCDIIDILQKRNFKDMAAKDVRNQLVVVCDLKKFEIQVNWLSNRLEKMLEAKNLVKEICSLKERKSSFIQQRDEGMEQVEACRAKKIEVKQTLDLIEKEEKYAEEKAKHAEAEIGKINKLGLEIKPKLMCFEKEGLHGGWPALIV